MRLTGTLDQRLTRTGAGWAVFAGFALLVAVWLTLGGLVLYERQSLGDRIKERNELLARVFADGVTRNIEATSLAAATLSDLLAKGFAPGSPEMRAAIQQTLVNLPFLRGINLVDSQGQILGGVDPAEWKQQIDIARLGRLPEPGTDVLGSFVPVRRLLDLRAQPGDGRGAGRGRLPAPGAHGGHACAAGGPRGRDDQCGGICQLSAGDDE